MPEYGRVVFTGASGTKYTLSAFGMDQRFNVVGAVYVITHRTEKTRGGNVQHNVVFVGQTADLSSRKDGMRRTICFEDHNANCICVLTENNQDKRLAIGADLLKAFNPPCNKVSG
ncbi:MAG: hypothetical protein HY521_14460 [Proteobacteria bacterium]|nr:hypothetical protein [Pseudomonadota bacterium]